MTTADSAPQCPECAQGKTSNCTGWALTDDDEIVACAFAE